MLKPPSNTELTLIQLYIKYVPNTGKFYWNVNDGSKIRIGKRINNVTKSGHMNVTLRYKQYLLHRIGWFLYYKEWPQKRIDHKDGNPTNNKISNLRLATQSENMQNAKRHRAGIPIGVGWHKSSQKWRATAPLNYLNWSSNKHKHLGNFDTMEEASDAVIAFCKKGNK